MLTATPATRVLLFEGAVDMRKSFEGLSGLARDKLGEHPISGHLFVFSNAARNRLKILFRNGSGPWVCGKRLERSRCPNRSEAVFEETVPPLASLEELDKEDELAFAGDRSLRAELRTLDFRTVL